MQINNNGFTSGTNSKQNTLEPSAERQSRDSSAGPSKDSVELSREAQTLKKLESQILASPDVDMGRVTSIRQAIAEGNYAIDAEAIALKMMESDKNF